MRSRRTCTVRLASDALNTKQVDFFVRWTTTTTVTRCHQLNLHGQVRGALRRILMLDVTLNEGLQVISRLKALVGIAAETVDDLLGTGVDFLGRTRTENRMRGEEETRWFY